MIASDDEQRKVLFDPIGDLRQGGLVLSHQCASYGRRVYGGL
jgi:hypothetical protein